MGTDDQKFVPSTTHEIPITFLARQDPVLDQILYYADVPLFEDELHDNGESILNARIVSQVRQDCFIPNCNWSLHHRCSPFQPSSTSCSTVPKVTNYIYPQGLKLTDSEWCLIHSLFSTDCSYVSTTSCSGYTMLGYTINSEVGR